MNAMRGQSFVLVAALTVSVRVGAQIPDEFRNLQVFPEDISRDELVDAMRHFSFALDVRCQHCHVGGDGVSFDGVEFDKDGPIKNKARFMIRMTRNLNDNVLSEIPDRDEPPLLIQCKTCHRGRSKPMLLTQEMRLALDASNVEAATDRYRILRETAMSVGAFDFREWEVNTLAEELADEDRPYVAIAIYELNAEFHPESVSIAWALGELYESVDENEAAIASYERVLELQPEHEGAQARLDALRN